MVGSSVTVCLPALMRSGILLALVGERAEAEHAVLALQLHAHAGRDVVRHQRRDADAEIDVEAVAQLLGGAFGHLIAGPGHQTSSLSAGGRGFARLRTVRCSMRFSALGTCMMRWTNTPGVMMWSPSISPGSTRCSTSATVTLAGGRHHRIEVARGLAVDEVAFGIALPGVHDREVGDEAGLHDVALAVELALFLALGDVGADAGLGEEGRDAGAAGADALGQRALRVELDLELAGEKLLREQLVLADIGRDHLLDLARLEQQAEAGAVDAGIVGHAR